MFAKIIHTLQEILPSLKEWLDWFWGIDFYIRDNFGVFAQITLYLLLVYFILILVIKILKATLNLVFYIILPSFALSLLTSFFISHPFFNILPFYLCLMLGINLLKFLR